MSGREGRKAEVRDRAVDVSNGCPVEPQCSDSLLNSENAHIYRGAQVANSSLGEGVTVGDFARVKDSDLGELVRIDRNNLVLGSTIGAYTYTGPFTMIFKTEIGKFCSISYGVTIAPPEHDYSRLTTHPFIYEGNQYGILDEADLLPNAKFAKPSRIGNDVWIGCNSTILRGVDVGNGAVVVANALVNRDVPPYAIVAGVPARIIRFRFSEKEIDRIQSLGWWDWPIEKIREEKELFVGNDVVERNGEEE